MSERREYGTMESVANAKKDSIKCSIEILKEEDCTNAQNVEITFRYPGRGLIKIKYLHKRGQRNEKQRSHE